MVIENRNSKLEENEKFPFIQKNNVLRVKVEKEHFHQNGKMCDFISSELNILAKANVIDYQMEIV